MRHGSLFSGIGGFDLAAEWMGWENVFQVEWDKWCQKVLAKNFPDTLKFGNIKEFNDKLENGEIITDTSGNGCENRCEETIGTERQSKQRRMLKSTGSDTQYFGRIDILSGGFPCQPFSHAGKRAGVADERYLWPEMLRTIRILKPSYVVGENVAGLVSMENGKTLDTILSDLENEGYTTEQVIIPACAVGAWHRRDRIWIIAYNDMSVRIAISRDKLGKTELSEFGVGGSDVANPKYKGLERYNEHYSKQHRKDKRIQFGSENCGTKNKRNVTNSISQRGCCGDTQRKYAENVREQPRDQEYGCWHSEPELGRVANGIPRKLDGINGINYEIIREELLALWPKDDPARMEKWEERFNIQEQKILQFAMLWLLDRVNIQNKENEWKENCTTKIQINNMRTMWIEEIIAEASQRWQYEKQQSGEYNNSLPGLSQGRTHQKQYMGSIWDEEPNTPRVASGIRNRVDRLKALGNAIVPQVAFEIFKAIEQLEIELKNHDQPI